MTILDRYLIRKFLFNLFFSTIAFVVIFLVVDLIENADKFIDRDTGLAKVLLYYGYYIPYIISLTLPVSMLLACLFALGGMSQHNEIVAQKSAGISLYRIFMPLFGLALIISVLSGFFDEMVVPEANERRMDLYRYDIQHNPRNESTRRNNIFLQDSKNRKVSIAFFNGATNEALNVSLQYFDGATLIRRVDAKKMRWIDQHWVLFDAVERVFEDTIEKVINYAEWAPGDFEFKPENLF